MSQQQKSLPSRVFHDCPRCGESVRELFDVSPRIMPPRGARICEDCIVPATADVLDIYPEETPNGSSVPGHPARHSGRYQPEE